MKPAYFICLWSILLLSGCNTKQPENGWYLLNDGKQAEGRPIVVVDDFAILRIDSAQSADNSMVYIIVGSLKKEKINQWADETERSIGKHIGFLYRGEILSAPRVNARIESGNFSISSLDLSKDKKRVLSLFENLVEEMK